MARAEVASGDAGESSVRRRAADQRGGGPVLDYGALGSAQSFHPKRSPMRKDLAIEELGGLLEKPLLAILATNYADGTTLLSPVWYEWRDGGFAIVVFEGDMKARHVERDPRVSVVVADAAPSSVACRCADCGRASCRSSATPRRWGRRPAPRRGARG
jgi:hypothetical protein